MFSGFNFHKQVSISEFIYIFQIQSTRYYFFRKGDSWSNFISCSDSKMINLGKSLSVSESESDRYLLDFLKEEVMICVYFSLVICSTTHHGVQLVLGISRGRGGPIRPGWNRNTLPVYSYQEWNSEPLPIFGFNAIQFNSGQNSLLKTQLTHSIISLPALIKIKGLGLFCKCRLNSTLERKETYKC